MPTPQHTRLINAAAKAALRPLGCVQKGRSRTWLDDQSWWVGVIEFQPSGWDKGSYLNVGACWLWYERDYLSFDTGSRVEGFHPYIDDEQFSLAAQKLAERASEEVMALRERFPSPSHACTWLLVRPPTSIWDHYHLAMSAGLAGATEQSKRSFLGVMADPEERPWAAEIKRRAAELMRCLELGSGFETEVMDTVRRARSMLKLPARAPRTA